MMLISLLPVIAALLVTDGTPVRASETDAYVLRYEQWASGIPAINDEVNRRIQAAVKESQSKGCSYSAIQSQMKKHFLRSLYGKVEGFINASETVSKRRVPLDQSVYQNARFYSNMPAHLGLLGFGSIIKSDCLLIGSDKFGHFFDEGYHYYGAMLDKGRSLDEAMNYGDQTEDGIFGIVTTGVKSYGDMAANFAGAHFWSDMLMPVIPSTLYNPFLMCERTGSKERWKQVRKFDFLDYLDGAWDEGVNCSQFRSGGIEESVNQIVGKLEAKSGKRYQCPVFPEECVELKKKYGKYAPRILHPKCLNVKI